jgi:hypothetical protein
VGAGKLEFGALLLLASVGFSKLPQQYRIMSMMSLKSQRSSHLWRLRPRCFIPNHNLNLCRADLPVHCTTVDSIILYRNMITCSTY